MSQVSYAQKHGSISGVVSHVIVKETGNIILKFETAHNDPTQCGNTIDGMIEASNPNKQEFLSLILAGYMAKQKQSFWVIGCVSQYGQLFPQITTATLSNI